MYRLRKTIEAASYFLVRAGSELPYIKLIKLLYLADREQMKRRGQTITGDTYWSLKYGPILEHTLDAIKCGNPDWNVHMQTDEAAMVISLLSEAAPAALSRAELQVLEDTWCEFGHMRWPDLVAFTHDLSEWTPVTSGRKRIHIEDVARALGYSEVDVKQILAAAEERDEIASMMEPLLYKPVHA